MHAHHNLLTCAGMRMQNHGPWPGGAAGLAGVYTGPFQAQGTRKKNREKPQQATNKHHFSKSTMRFMTSKVTSIIILENATKLT